MLTFDQLTELLIIFSPFILGIVGLWIQGRKTNAEIREMSLHHAATTRAVTKTRRNVETIAAEVSPNHGSSLKDAVARIEAAQQLTLEKVETLSGIVTRQGEKIGRNREYIDAQMKQLAGQSVRLNAQRNDLEATRAELAELWQTIVAGAHNRTRRADKPAKPKGTMHMTTAPADPFRYVAKASTIIHALARQIYNMTRATAADVWIGRGYAPDSVEHKTGRALDVITSTKVGRRPTPEQHRDAEALCAWLIRHAQQLHLRHIIYNRRIWSRRYGYWRPLQRPAGASVSDWHEDHIHLWLDDVDGSVPNAPLVATPKPSPGPGTSTPPKPITKPPTRPKVSLSGLVNAAQTDPQRPDQKTTNWAAVKPVENALVVEGYLHSDLADGHFGTATKAAYRAWQKELGYRGSDADGIPGRQSLVKLGAIHGFDVVN